MRLCYQDGTAARRAEAVRARIRLYQLGEVGQIDGDPGKRAAAAAIEAGEILPHGVVHQNMVTVDQQIPRILARQVAQELGRLGAPLKLLAAVTVVVGLAAAGEVKHQQIFRASQRQIDSLAIGGKARRERVGDDLAAVADAWQIDLQKSCFLSSTRSFSSSRPMMETAGKTVL